MLRSRVLGTLLAGALGVVLVGVPAEAQAQKAKAARTQRPQQIIPTGDEDAVQPATAQGLAAAQGVQAQLESELDQMTSRSDEGLVAVRHEDGSESVNLQGRFMSVVIAVPRAGGGHSLSCHSGAEALALLKGKPIAVPPVPPPAPAPALELK